ncbi:VOC family protein [Peteryoungia desertarenae]|uniref:VOC family protein n=1 Tax=Peteryoungia desertarenae TaxID=1813451 RepID=UPI001FE3799E|nr:VOC family protein [Peteryoungia desertarenae]
MSIAYHERLGWKRSSASNDQITFIQMKGLVLALFSRVALATDAGVEDGNCGFAGVTLAHNVPSDRGVDAVVRFALSCGARLVRKPEKASWGGYSGYVADPDGHLWEISHNPYFPLDHHGHIVLPA